MWFSYAFIGNHVTNASLTSATNITVPNNANGILIQSITQNVRVKFGGNPATASEGFQIKAGDPTVLMPVPPGGTISIIQETATASVGYQFVRVHDQMS